MNRRVAIWLVAAFSALYIAVGRGHFIGTDEVGLYNQTQALWSRGSLDVGPINNSFRGQDGKYYSQYPIGQSLMALPLYALAEQIEFHLPATWQRAFAGQSLGTAPTRWGGDVPIFFVGLFNAFAVATLVGVFYLFSRDLGAPPRAALASTSLLGMTTYVALHATHFLPHPLESLLVLASFYCLFLDARQDSARYRWLAGFLAAALLQVRVTAPILYPALFLYLGASIIQRRGWHLRPIFDEALPFVAPLVASAVVYGWVGYLKFGTFPPRYNYEGFATPLIHGLYGFTLSPGASIFVFSPLLVLSPWLFRSFAREHRAEAATILLMAVSYLLCFSKYSMWHGQWSSIGPRYLMAIVPLLLLPLGKWLDQSPLSGRGMALLLGGAGLLVQVLCISLNWPFLYNAQAWPAMQPPFAFLFIPQASPLVASWHAFWQGQFLDLWLINTWRTVSPIPAVGIAVPALAVIAVAANRILQLTRSESPVSVFQDEAAATPTPVPPTRVEGPRPAEESAVVRRTTEILAAIIIFVFLGLVWSAAGRKSETVDEPLFIANGVAQVELRDPNFDLSHPPVLRLLAGLSAEHLGGASRLPQPVPGVPRGAMELYQYKLVDSFNWATAFFYDSGNDHDRALFWGRFPFAFFGVLAGLLIFFEARRTLGSVPALAGFAAFAFAPEVLAHAQWAHSDLASAATIVVTALTLARALEDASSLSDLLLGAALGLAINVKFTAVVLVPVVLGLVAFWPQRSGGMSQGKRAVFRCVRILLSLYVVIVAAYLPAPRLWPHEFFPTDLAHLIAATDGSRAVSFLAAALRWLPLPDSFLKGMIYTALLGHRGQLAYFHGEVRADGWWYYFPVAVVLKYPTTLLLIAATGFVAVWRESALSWARRVAWTVPPLVLFAAAMAQKIDIGVRSVLTVAPFLGLWTAAAVATTRNRLLRAVALTAVALSVYSGVSAWPDFLSWFNPFFGGTPAADRWLVDSNLDWGQDMPELARVLRQRGIGSVHLAFFGWARPEHWQIRALDATVREPGWYAVSRSYFSGIWGPTYAWLRDIPPTELVGGSVALIEVTPEFLRAQAPQTTAEQEESLMKLGLAARYQQQQPLLAAEIFAKVLALNPTHYGALFQRAAALDAAGQSQEALQAWKAFEFQGEKIGDFTNLALARQRIRWLEAKVRR